MASMFRMLQKLGPLCLIEQSFYSNTCYMQKAIHQTN